MGRDRYGSDRAHLTAQVKFFGRHKGGAIRDGVLISAGELAAPPPPAAWPCHGDEATAVMDGEAELISALRFPARSQSQ